MPLYDKYKIQYGKGVNSFAHKNLKCEIISLYNGGMFLEELLNNACSLKQVGHENLAKS